MIKINLINAQKLFLQEAEYNRTLICRSQPVKEAKARIDQIDNKIRHTYDVMQDGKKVVDILGFDGSCADFVSLALLDHDIGRFLQMRLTGTYKDYEAKEQIGINDHGVLGQMLLLGELERFPFNVRPGSIIKEQVPDSDLIGQSIAEIVREHVTGFNTDDALRILKSDVFKNYTIEEILGFSQKQQHDTLSAITQIIQDVDRLDIYHQILSGRFIPPAVIDEPVHPIIIDKFYRGEYLNINLLKSQGLWNVNAGDLVRLSFINQIRLLSVAQVILDENLIMRLKEKRNSPYVVQEFDFAQKQLEEIIANSEDGITVGKAKIYK